MVPSDHRWIYRMVLSFDVTGERVEAALRWWAWFRLCDVVMLSASLATATLLLNPWILGQSTIITPLLTLLPNISQYTNENMAETTAICTVYEKKHFLVKSISAQTLSVNVSALLRTECRILVDVAGSDPALLSLAVWIQWVGMPHAPTRRPKHHSVKLQAWIARHQSVTTPSTHEGMARLSWPGWLVTYRDKCPAPEIEPGYGYPPQY